MSLLIQVQLLLRRFAYAVVVSVFFFTASQVISHAQSSSLLFSGNQVLAVQVTELDEKPMLTDPDVTELLTDSDSTVSDPPATTDQNNSTGDEILLRPPR